MLIEEGYRVLNWDIDATDWENPDYRVIANHIIENVKDKESNLTLYQEYWLLCEECGMQYPIVDDIPVMLLDEGEKWVNTKITDLPVPPPDLN